jgi:hypothetical protein
MEEEEIVRGAQALAAVLRVGLTYLAAALLLFMLCRFEVAHVPVRSLGCWSGSLLFAIPLTLGVEALVRLMRLKSRSV